MSVAPDAKREKKYLEILLEPLRISAKYKPMFGKGKKGGLSLEEFQSLYRADPF